MEYDGICGPPVSTGPYVRQAFAMEGKQPNDNPKKLNRKNPWGSRSYADLITQAIEASPEKRLTLSQIYEWMIRNIPFFSNQAESNSSAGWKNSIRHNLSLHKKFMRIRNDGTGKSSWWMVDEAAGSGRTPRRKGTYRRRKGKRILPHNQVENFQSFPKNRRRNLFPNIIHNGNHQGNLWLRKPEPDVKPWSGLQYATEETQANSNQPFNSSENLPSFSALYNDRSWKANFHLSTGTPYHSEQFFISQTSSLKTETSSRGSCHSSYQAYHQEQVIFHKASFNKTVSTEYFMSPHHLSGSYITTEVARNKTDSDNGNFLNTGPESNCLPSSEAAIVRQILQQDESDVSNDEIDFLLNKEIQDNAVDLRTVLDELSEIKNYESNYRNIHNFAVNPLTSMDLQSNQDTSPLKERHPEVFDELNNEQVYQLNSSRINSHTQRKRKNSDETENTSVALQNSDIYDLSFDSNHSNEDDSFLFSDENKLEDVSIPLNFQNIASHQSSDCNTIEEIIQKLTSPYSDVVDSFSETADTPAYQLSSPSPGSPIHSGDENGNVERFVLTENRTNMALNCNEISPGQYQDTNQSPQSEISQVPDNVVIGAKTIITDAISRRQGIFSHQPNSACLEEIIQKLNSSRDHQDDSVDRRCKIYEYRKNSASSESSSSSIYENQNSSPFRFQGFEKNEKGQVDEVFMDTELSMKQSSELVLSKNVSHNSEMKPENFITNMLEETSTKFDPDSEVLSPHDVDAYFSNCLNFKNSTLTQKNNINAQNTSLAERQCLNFYSNDINQDESSKDIQNIPDHLLKIFLNSDNHFETADLLNLSQNFLSHKTVNDNVSDTIVDATNSVDFLRPNSKSKLLTFNSLSGIQNKCLDNVFVLSEVNNSFFQDEKYKIEEVPLLAEEDNSAKSNFLYRAGSQNTEGSSYDMDQSSSDIEICEKLKKSSIESSSNFSSEFCSGFDSFDEYDDPHMRRESGDPCLLSESSNSYQGFDIDLPVLKFDDIARDENFNLDYSCNQPDTLSAVDDSLFEYIRNGILQDDSKFFDYFHSVASYSEADSKDNLI